MTQIRMIDGHLDVPNTPTLPFIVGDGIGQDIWSSAQHVFDAAVKKVYNGEHQVDWLKVLAGKEAFASRGMSLPAETIDAITEHLVAIKGPLETPVGEGIRSLNVALRQELDLYACVRPVRYFEGI
ncbi:MAG: isocitrate/isopropylmalate family dehydrogenase, partial [Alloscardovia omnicolens]|nr:isocitrate/isopropylmalate family dehydrogenase [Alloscardovia omnicolens]